jgi:ATP-dependent DNA helicase RecG
MTGMTILSQTTLGEDSNRQFNTDMKNAESLSSEMAAFDNTGGMVISGHVDLISDRLSMEAAA